MNREQFIAHARATLTPEEIDGLRESISEYNGETAAFGSAGPGTFTQLAAEIRRVNKIERQLARLENREPRDFYLRLRVPA